MTRKEFLKETKEALYQEVRNADDTIYFEYSNDEWYFTATVDLNFKFVDDSFSHEFGTYYDYHYECDGIDEIKDVELWQTINDEDVKQTIDSNELHEWIDNFIN